MSAAVRIETGVPGYPISVEECDGIVIERNGAGSVVAHVYPFGLEDEHEGESLTERVGRLTEGLKDARALLRKATR